MIVEAQVSIDGTKTAIWDVITDIENASESVCGIDQVEILEKPENGLVGLKWRETRTVFGKTATEEMWITEVAENRFFESRAESHGFRYISTSTISENGGQCSLTRTHESQPLGFMAKVLSIPMGFAFKGVLRKALLKDLIDIKGAVEQKRNG